MQWKYEAQNIINHIMHMGLLCMTLISYFIEKPLISNVILQSPPYIVTYNI